MKKVIPFISIIAFLLCGNCTGKHEVSPEEKQVIAEEIHKRMDGYPEALKRKNLDWFHGFWSDEAGFVFAGDGQVLTDYNATITQPLENILSNLQEVLYFEFNNRHIKVLSKDAVSCVANFDWGVVMNSGDTVRSKGAWLYVFRKSNDQWKVIHSAGTHNYY